MEALIQNTKGWLAWRKDKIGASDSAAIMGVSKFKTAYQLWLEKTSDCVEEKNNFSMQRGKDLEESARKCYESRKHNIFFPFVKIHCDFPFIIASMDGLTMDGRYGVEIKCPGKIDHELAMSGQIPKHYFPQLQHQMFVCNLPNIDYFSYVNDEDNVILTIERDARYIDKMLEAEIRFKKLMDDRIPPELTDKDYVQRKDSLWGVAAAEWQAAKVCLSNAQESEERARKALISLSHGENCSGYGVTLLKTSRKGVIDYSAIPDLQNINLEPYRKEATSYITIREEKTHEL